MSTKNKIIILGIILVVSFSMVAFKSSAENNLDQSAISDEYCKGLIPKDNGDLLSADYLICQNNIIRKENGKVELKNSLLLQEAAQRKAEDMAKKGYFSHETPDGKSPWIWLDSVGYKYGRAGENLAINYFDSEDIVSAWMESPSHKANVLNGEFAEAGVGIAKGKYNGEEAIFIVEFYGQQRTITENISVGISELFNGIL